MAEATAQEQFFLELINRARMDPLGEADRYGIALNQGLPAGSISSSAKQVLAFNSDLNAAADSHSNWMLQTDVFDHTGQGGSDPGDRMESAGYAFSGSWTWGENIAWSGTTGTLNVEQTVLQEHRSLFLSAGHRGNILGEDFREAGMGALEGQFTSKGITYNALMTTENFAKSGNTIFVTGVAYDDLDHDAFYSMGEGSGSHSVQLLQAGVVRGSTITGQAGGYALGTLLTGAVEIRFSGGGLLTPLGVAVTLGATNAKVDLVDGSTILSNVSAALTGGSLNLQLIGLEDISGTANNAGNSVSGNAGDNLLSGLGGHDFLGGAAGRDTLMGGGGNDVLSGGAQADRLTGGAGYDTFDFGSIADMAGDLITDFAIGRDRIDLSAIDAVTGGSDSAFHLVAGGMANFTGAGAASAGELRFSQTVTRTLVQGDINGDGTADFTIRLAGQHDLMASDFML